MTTSPFERISDRPVIICGHPRSGTTLLASLLDAHPELSVLPEELNFFHHIFRSHNRRADIWTHSGYKIIANSPLYADIDQAEVRRKIDQLLLQKPSERALLVGLMAIWHEVRLNRTGQERRWVEKTPKCERWATLLHSWFGEECVFLHIVRDPRDNFDAYRKEHPKVRTLGFADRWRYSTALGLRNSARLANYHLLRYEDLVRDPKSVMDHLAELIGIAPDPSLYLPTKNGRIWSGNSSEAKKFAGVSTSQIGKYRSRLTIEEIRAIERLTSPYFARLDYHYDTSAGLPGFLSVWTPVRVCWQTLRLARLSRVYSGA